MEKRPRITLVWLSNGRLGTIMRGAIGMAIAGFLLLAAPDLQLPPQAGEVRVMRDATLDRTALEQARAMAAKDNLSHARLVH